MSDNTVLNTGTGGDVIRDLDRGLGSKTQVVQLDVGGPSSNPESLVSINNPLPVTGTIDVRNIDVLQYDDDGYIYVTPSPSADIATGQNQLIQTAVLAQIAAGHPVSQQGQWTVSVASAPVALAPNAAQETSGQLQRIADLLESVLIELRVATVILSTLNQAAPEDADKLRGDMNLSIQ